MWSETQNFAKNNKIFGDLMKPGFSRLFYVFCGSPDKFLKIGSKKRKRSSFIGISQKLLLCTPFEGPKIELKFAGVNIAILLCFIRVYICSLTTNQDKFREKTLSFFFCFLFYLIYHQRL